MNQDAIFKTNAIISCNIDSRVKKSHDQFITFTNDVIGSTVSSSVGLSCVILLFPLQRLCTKKKSSPRKGEHEPKFGFSMRS